ncbi:strawberry notch C-terminal domain-containing protein [Sinorhizobium meliloti]|uniref:strawberry notch C-terminal domain-containing protein n=1 Tax=Rhizobium meliloti TaxID=382 RepID=UPI000B5A622E|nr:strawberry notch C-terminal domain-containing protein [Sinorhizobium meliloti]ASJ61637.1 hypothetical protein SMB554_21105 [Sinorhizobium meliloti]MCK3785313.1 strawberry notch C-terminal domain-containing protein [Sinorhizobium meliloti]MCK3791438.1 strawberry notch C-terminal domain-containing protein [Sinorhizobium meliloti]MCK3797432.1 strawberry notch C-terminal domain-containing protein [Sinorhizobium meliloti]MDE3876365.1 strawberry notch C-terminal domain-containing protein [Sinorhi
MNVTSFRAANAAAVPLAPSVRADRAGKNLVAGHQLLPFLERGQAIGTTDLRATLTNVVGGSDAEGFSARKDAYAATEVAQVLFLRKLGAAISARANAPQAALIMLKKVVGLILTHTRRSEESQQLQQFSTPLPLGLVAAHAAGVIANDTLHEPSAGTGFMAIVPPRFRMIATNVKAERRFLSTIARRLDALDAITRGQRQTGGLSRLSRNFGLDQTEVLNADQVWQSLLGGSSVVALAGGMTTLRRVRLMGNHRVALSGSTDGMRDRLKSMGLFSETIAWKLRFFIPTSEEGSAILARLVERHPIVDVTGPV